MGRKASKNNLKRSENEAKEIERLKSEIAEVRFSPWREPQSGVHTKLEAEETPLFDTQDLLAGVQVFLMSLHVSYSSYVDDRVQGLVSAS